MITIPLNLGYVALIDDEDLELISQFTWHVNIFPRRVYAHTKRRIGPGKRWYTTMHRLLLPYAAEVDHRDGNGLNNQKGNLRPTRQENIRNSRPRLGYSSQYKGVYQEKRYWHWVAQIQTAEGRLSLGTFPSEEFAARAYDAAAREHFGEFARLNFPEVTV